METTTDHKSRKVFLSLIFALTVRVLLSVYWILRYGGNWVEGDSARMTPTIITVLQSGHLISSLGRIYSAGFLYPVYGASVALVANISAVEFQTWISLPMAMGLTLVVFTFYRRLLGNPIAAAAATVMLNLQGDFLATISRGTHEKLSYTLIFASFLVMGIALERLTSLRQRLALALVYYLATFALSTTNVFFASTFTATLIFASLVGVVLTLRLTLEQDVTFWLIYIAIISFIFIYLFIFVLYPPALHLVQIAGDLFERLYLFLFSFEEAPADVYQIVDLAWIFPGAWLVLRVFDLFLVALAAAGWLDLVYRLRRREKLPHGLLSVGRFWLLGLFPAFAIQNTMALFSDLTGSVANLNNLQVRIAPLTAFTAAPLAVYILQRLFAVLRAQRLWHRLATISLVGVTVVFVGIALIKSTSEPLLSNVWWFYMPDEAASVDWLDKHNLLLSFQGGRRTPRVWAGPDFRIGRVWLNNYWEGSRELVPVTVNEPYQFVLLSPTIRMLTARQHLPLPNIQPTLRIYDNGATQLYFRPSRVRQDD